MVNKFCIARSAHITKNHPCSSCNSRTSECKLSCPQLAEYEEKRLQNDRERKKYAMAKLDAVSTMAKNVLKTQKTIGSYKK